jgi:predicted esterase
MTTNHAIPTGLEHGHDDPVHLAQLLRELRKALRTIRFGAKVRFEPDGPERRPQR